MDAEINNVIYMELNSGPKIANSTCGKTIDVETIVRDSTVFVVMFKFCYTSLFCALIKDIIVHHVLLFTQIWQNFYIYDNNYEHCAS